RGSGRHRRRGRPPAGARPRRRDRTGRRARPVRHRRGAAEPVTPLVVMLVAAEASGDDRGADLMRALRRRLGPDGVRFVGVGGARMAAEGLASPFDIAELSILGLLEGLLAYPKVVKRADETAALAARERPDVA